MASIEIKRPVAVKVIMTEAFRQELLKEARESLESLDRNLKQMEEEARKQITALDITNPQQASLLTQQLEAERDRIQRMRAELEWRMKEAGGVAEGQEIPFRVLEGSVPLAVGDNFLDKISRAEVVLKDWHVVEIRDPAR